MLVISVERIQRDSLAGRSISAQADAFRGAMRADLSERRDALRAEERAIADQRDALTPAAFDARVAQFEDRVRALRRDEQDGTARLQRAVSGGFAALREKLRPVLVAVMSERSAAVMLESANVLISARTIDVTDEVIQRLDRQLSVIDLELPASPAR